jgi:hypothetical protein
MLDHRGYEMSDTIAESRLGNLDDRIADAFAVLDAAGVDQVCVFGEGDGGSLRSNSR